MKNSNQQWLSERYCRMVQRLAHAFAFEPYSWVRIACEWSIVRAGGYSRYKFND